MAPIRGAWLGHLSPALPLEGISPSASSNLSGSSVARVQWSFLSAFGPFSLSSWGLCCISAWSKRSSRLLPSVSIASRLGNPLPVHFRQGQYRRCPSLYGVAGECFHPLCPLSDRGHALRGYVRQLIECRQFQYQLGNLLRQLPLYDFRARGV